MFRVVDGSHKSASSARPVANRIRASVVACHSAGPAPAISMHDGAPGGRCGSGEPQGKLAVRTEASIDEGLNRCRQHLTGKTKTAHDLAGDIFRDIFGPTLGSVEGHYANRIVILAGHQIGNYAFQIGPPLDGLTIGAPQTAEVIEHEIDGLIATVRHNRGGPASTHTELHQQTGASAGCTAP